jgi:hypothetical protein
MRLARAVADVSNDDKRFGEAVARHIAVRDGLKIGTVSVNEPAIIAVRNEDARP